MKNVLGRWYSHSSVRTGPHHTFREEIEDGKYLFPPSLVPYLGHPRLAGLDDHLKGDLVTRHLYQYLSFTAYFEPAIVNRALQRIAAGSVPMNVTRATRLDALKIYTDEGYHALFSLDLVGQIEAATGIAGFPYNFTPYREQADKTLDALLPADEALGQLLQVIIFETAVTSILGDIPTDPGMVSAVRAVINDHATDERVHHAFFSLLFSELWTALDIRKKQQVALVLPRLIVAAVKPHIQPIGPALQAAGLDSSAVAEVLHDTYADLAERQYARAVSRHTVNLFARNGVLDMPGASEAFALQGLLPQA